MAVYFRFVFVMTIGLFGLTLVLIVLLDNLLADWDPAGAFYDFLNGVSNQGNYVVVQELEEEDGAPRVVTRLIPERRKGRREPVAALPEPSPEPAVETLVSPEAPATIGPAAGSNSYWIGPRT